MKKYRITVVLGMLLLAMGILSGCGKVTPEKLIEQASANVQKVSSYKAKMDMGFNVSMEQEGQTQDMALSMDADMDVTNKPVSYHLNGKLNIEQLNLSMGMEMYGIEDEDKATTYINVANQWSKSEVKKEKDSEKEKKNIDFTNLEQYLGENTKLVLADKTEKENDKEVYVISTTLGAEYFKQFTKQLKDAVSGQLEDMGQDEELMNQFEKMDFSAMNMDVKLKIYKDSKLPASISVDIKGGLNELLKSMIASFTPEEVGVDITKCTFNITFTEFDTVEKIVVPKEALDAKSTDEQPSVDVLEDEVGSEL